MSKNPILPYPTIRNSRFAACAVMLVIATWLAVGTASAQPPAAPAPAPGAHVPAVPLPDPAAGRAVSLREMLAHADRHAPAVHVARRRLGLGDAAMAAATPLFASNPELAAGAGPRFGPGGRGTEIEFSAQQTVEIAGERRLRMAAAARTTERLRAELEQVRWDVHRDVHAAFHEALVARARADVAARLLAFQERLLEIARQRLQAGDTSPLPVRLAEGETAQARVAGIAAQQAYEAARLRLAEVAGWPAAHPPAPAGTLDRPRPAPPRGELDALAQRHQPALHTLQAARAEAEARAALAAREAWPRPTIGIAVQREDMDGAAETAVIGTLAIPLPLWQRNQGERAAARATLGIAAAQVAAFQQQLDTRLTRAARAVDAAARRMAVYGQEILPRFEDNLRMLERAYELGEIDVLQVSVARERFLRIQSDALDAHADYFAAVAELEAVVGTDLWHDEAHEHDDAPGDEP